MEMRMPLRLLALLLISFSATTFAKVDEPTPLCDPNRLNNHESINTIVALQNSIAESSCPNPGRMDHLCQYLRDKNIDNRPDSDYTYEFQRIVYEASCVDYIADSEEEISRKVNSMWNRFGANLRCGPMGTPPTGSPLRYSIHVLFDEFIREAISLWKIDLNKLENGMTMLDFIDDRIAHTSSALKPRLESYRESFIKMGAKRSSEL